MGPRPIPKRHHSQALRLIYTVTAMKNINKMFPSLIVVNEWLLYPIVMAMATEIMGIMATDGGVHTVTAMESNEDWFYLPLPPQYELAFSRRRCRCRSVWV